MQSLQPTIDELKIRVIADQYVDITSIVENADRKRIQQIRSSVYFLRTQEGYTVHYYRVTNNGVQKIRKILASPGVGYQEIFRNLTYIK